MLESTAVYKHTAKKNFYLTQPNKNFRSAEHNNGEQASGAKNTIKMKANFSAKLKKGFCG